MVRPAIFLRLLMLLVTIFGAATAFADVPFKVIAQNRANKLVSGATVVVQGPVTERGTKMTYTGTTGGDGSVSFKLAEPGIYIFTVNHPEHRASSNSVTLGPDGTTYRLILSSQSFFGVDFTITDKKGKGLKNAWVQIKHIAQGATLTWALYGDAEGKVSVNLPAAAEYSVTAGADFHTSKTVVILVADSQNRAAHSIALDSQMSRILLTLVSEDGYPIVGAKVHVQSEDGIEQQTETSQADGIAYVVIDKGGGGKEGRTYKIAVTHKDYEAAGTAIVTEKGSYRDYRETLEMKRLPGLKVVIVNVVKDGGELLSMANVAFRGKTFVYDASTDQNGRAVLTVRPDDYTIVVSRSGFDNEATSLAVKQHDGKDTYTVDVSMAEKELQKEYRRGIRVIVKMDVDGKRVPAKNVAVQLSNGQAGRTDERGFFDFYHRVAPGETLYATATAPNEKYKDGKGSVVVGASGTLVDRDAYKLDLDKATAVDRITIVLAKDKEVALSGDLVIPKARVEVGEKLVLTTGLLYGGGRERVLVDIDVVIVNSKGAKVATLTASRTLTRDNYDHYNFSFTPTKEGTYTAKATAGTGNESLWKDSQTFTVTAKKKVTDKPAAKTANFGGTWWSSEASHLVMRQSGNAVEGEYNYAGGKIKGTVKGRVLEFTWEQTNDRKGWGRFTMSDSNDNSFSGEWDYTHPAQDAGKKHNWSGSRKSDKEEERVLEDQGLALLTSFLLLLLPAGLRVWR